MAAPRSILAESSSASQQLGRLVQAQLLKVGQRTSTRRPETLGDLRAMVDALSSLSDICITVLDDIRARGQERKLSTAVEEIENVLEWTEQSEVPFDLEFKRTFSVNKFAALLAKHLGKTQEEKRTGDRVETCFLSMSPVLEWTVHATGQKWKDGEADETVGLAVFDARRLRQTPDLTIFRVSNILQFLKGRGKGELIPRGIQEWAQNCDEYVLMGKVHRGGLLRWVPWTELYGSGFLSSRFLRAYTLGKYRQWRDEVYDAAGCVEAEDVCRKVVEFGKMLAGRKVSNLLPLVELILKPGFQFWELKANASEEVVKARVYELVDESMLGEFFRLKISGD
ncbi:uncharacterized protein BDR25DRAFT_339154 [Lindgomyces ingoldianus]|uniref:Uncharacterized protein n=1 Tax=Lindgomyces ingoldianus TaxID=673940 RepID=A0ACB6RDF0_9PLEO|nr:uncharacterized protein BDR25DRAFT_339154 [Lindgomyces ingoldianus]KAF2477137.1 hypothetical protein BDR25DRAFT_339154 [Lindgomyces ingoldianus]